MMATRSKTGDNSGTARDAGRRPLIMLRSETMSSRFCSVIGGRAILGRAVHLITANVKRMAIGSKYLEKRVKRSISQGD
jgi:hypothetical protein